MSGQVAMGILAGAVFAVIGVRLGILLRDRRQLVATDRECRMPVKRGGLDIESADLVEVPPANPASIAVCHSVSGSSGHRGKRGKKGRRR